MIDAIVDISHFNASPDWTVAEKAGVKGVIHKATQGSTGTDATFAPHRRAATEAGLWWGAYHFGTGEDGVLQAKHFLGVATPGPHDLLALDLEPNPQGPSMNLTQAEAFVKHVQAITGRWPGLYGGSYVAQLLAGVTSTVLANCWLWLAEYGPTPHVPHPWPTWTLWQYTDGRTHGAEAVPGLGPCDRSRFNGPLDGLARLWGHTEASPPPGKPPSPPINSTDTRRGRPGS